MNKILVEVSVGELLDKISILEIKKEKIKDQSKLKFINEEFKLLKDQYDKNVKPDDKINKLFSALKEINNKLWNIEDKIRIKEKLKTFDNEFIEIARSVYIENDKRSEIKREINIKCNSELVEEKSY